MSPEEKNKMLNIINGTKGSDEKSSLPDTINGIELTGKTKPSSLSKIGIEASNNAFSFTEKDFNDYLKYGVILNPGNTEEELNRERAENQSVLEQIGRSVGRMVWSEAILGTLRGFGDIWDAVTTINMANYEKQDYTNAYSKFFEDAQDRANKRMEIYRKDPNATWAFNDFGWWADNAVSVASTLSLLIPAKGIVGGVSFIGKGLKYAKTAGKLAKADKIGDVLRGISKSEHIWDSAIRGTLGANKYSKYAKLSNAADIGATALVSRIGENYIEARDIYNTVHKETLDSLNTFNESERQEFFKNNPEFIGKSDEEIANYIAGESASRTYRDDFAMLLMDIAQFKAVSGMFKVMPNRAAGVAIRKANAKSILSVATDKAVTEVEEKVAKSATKGIFSAERRAMLKNSFKGIKPWNIVEALEIGEGFEEGYQSIISKTSEDLAKKYLDPNYTDKSLLSYLQDREVWEQAFWGMLGGIAFQGAGRGLNKISNWAYTKINKDLSEKDVKILLRGENARRIAEIEGREAKLNKFTSDLKLVLQDGKNPFRKIEKDGEIDYADIENPEEKERLIELLYGGIAEELTFGAVEAGNYDLFKTWVDQSTINDYIKQEGGDIDIDLENRLKQDMDSIAEQYSETYGKIIESADVANPFAAQLATRSIIRKERQVHDMELSLNNLRNKLNNLSETKVEGVNVEEDIGGQIYNQILTEIDQLNTKEEGLQILYNSKKPSADGTILTKSGLDANLQDINDIKKALATYLIKYTPFGSNERALENYAAHNYSDVLKAFTDNEELDSSVLEKYTPSTQNLIKEIAATEVYKSVAEQTIPKSKDELARIYEDFEYVLYNTENSRFNDAYNKLKSFIENSKDYDAALSQLLSEDFEDPDLKEAVKILKLGYDNREDLTKDFLKDINKLKEKDAEEAEKTNTEERGGEELMPGVEKSEPVETPKPVVNPDEAAADKGGVVIEEINDKEDPTLTKAAAAEAAAALQRLTTINTSDWEAARSAAVEAANAVISKKSKEFYNLLNGKSVDVTLDYTNFLNWIAAELVNNFNIDQSLANSVAEHGLLTYLETPYSKRAFAKRPDLINKLVAFTKLVKTISTSVDWTKGFEDIDDAYDASKIRLLSQEELYDKFIEFLNTYSELQENIYSKNGKSYINLYDVAQYLLELADEQAINYDTLVQAITNLRIFAKNYKGSEFVLEGVSFIEKNAESIIEDVYQKLTTYENISEDLHFDVHNTKDYSKNKQKSLIAKFKEFRSKNKELKIEYRNNITTGEPISISLYYKDDTGDKQEIGYLDLVNDISKGNKNTAFARTKGTGFRYAVSLQGDDYKMVEPIDKLFKEIIKGSTKNATKEQKALYTLFRNIFITNDSTKSNEFNLVKNSEEYKIDEDEKLKFLNSNLFLDLLDATENSEVLYGIGVYETKYVKALEKEIPILTHVLSKDEFKKLDDSEKLDKAGKFFNDVANILFYELKSYASKKDSAVNLNKQAMLDSYNNFVKKTFDNYKATNVLQAKLDEARTNGMTNLAINYKKDNAAKINYSENGKERGIGGISTIVPLTDIKQHPYVFVYGNTLYDEYGKSYNTPGWMRNGTSGLLMYDNGNPFIAMFTGANIVSETNKDLANAINKYFNTAVNKYLSAIGKDAETEYENLYNTFESLIGRQRLFKGFEVEKLPSSDAFALKYVDDNGTKHTYVTFFKYSSDIHWEKDHYETTDGKRVANKDKHLYAKPAISVILNGKKRNIYNNVEDNAKKEITKFINVILNGHKTNGNQQVFEGLKYNSDASVAKYYKGTSEAGINPTILKRNGKINEYISKKDGKLVIKIGDFEHTYDNYAHFLVSNNAMMTTHKGRTNRTINDYSTAPSSVYVDIDSVHTPVDEEENELIKKGLNTYIKEKFPKGTGTMKVYDILRSTGLTQVQIEEYKRLSDSIGKKYHFLPDEVEIDTIIKTSDDGAYYHKNSNNEYKGKIVLFKNGINMITRYGDKDAVRLLVHEQIHKVIDVNDFFNGEIGKERASVITDIWNQLYKHTRDFDKTDTLRIFADKFYNAWSKYSEETIANEFIAEVMSQPGLMDRLNNIDYNGKYTIGTYKETLLQKLLRLIMSLFDNNISSINENTLLDNLHKILGDDAQITITTPAKVGKKVEKIESVPAEVEEETGTDASKEEAVAATLQGNTPLPENSKPEEHTEDDEEDDEEDDDDEDSPRRFKAKKLDYYDDEDRDSSKIRSYAPIELAIDDVKKDGTNNPNDLSFVPNMESFMSKFPTADRAAIEAELTAGRIKYVCQ